MKRTLLVFGVASLACGLAVGQQQMRRTISRSNPIISSFEEGWQEAGAMNEVVKGAPFSAQQTQESTRTLGDGTHITNKSTVTYTRDSAGRVRREDNEIITIYDPVAGITYRLNKNTHTAVKFELVFAVQQLDLLKRQLEELSTHLQTQQQQAEIKAEAEKALLEAEVQVQDEKKKVSEYKSRQDASVTLSNDGYAVTVNRGVEESLGSQVINGVMADGMRTTSTIPLGDMGNDRPIQSTIERWYSPELHLTVLYKRIDPREGDVITQYTNIQRAEPNAALFQVPAGYTVREEKRRQEEIQ